MVMRVLPGSGCTTAPRFPLLKSYSFFIGLPLLLRGLPRRDDSYDIRDPACIYDNEYLQRKVHADGDETTFTFGVLVFDSYGQFVFEHANGIGKINAMLFTI